MSDKETPGIPQQDHWEDTYAGNPAFFGEEPSEFGLYAADLFLREGAGTVLELGCGHGRDTLMFARNGFSVTALDYSEKALEVLSSKAAGAGAPKQIATHIFDVRRPLPFPDGFFDACYSHMLLCMELSTEELKFILGEIRRVLKVGGLALYRARPEDQTPGRAGGFPRGRLRFLNELLPCGRKAGGGDRGGTTRGGSAGHDRGLDEDPAAVR